MTNADKRNLKKKFDRANNQNSKRRMRRIKEENRLICEFLKGSK